jgi:folate-binding protein YgfZ
MAEIASTSNSARGMAARLDHLGLIAASGADAASFLHNQLTNDVEGLPADQWRLAGYCSPKGRLLATLAIWKNGEGIILQMPRELLPALQKRLQMFVLRSKVKLADVSDQYALFGVAGTQAAAALAPWFTDLPSAPGDKRESSAGALLRLADAGGLPRYQWIAAGESAAKAWPALGEHLPAVDSAAWRLGDIAAGIPLVTQATQEQFVPQMINFEVIGGVNFRKGCYPGQEIVARSQYLGKLKRRMMRASVQAPAAAAGMEVFSSAEPEQPCGMVVNAEAAEAGRFDCLVELKTALLDQGSVHLGAIGGPALQFLPLPYALPDPA